MSDLKPCPLCGGSTLCQFWTDEFHVKCIDCDLTIKSRESESVCAKKWNKRTFTINET